MTSEKIREELFRRQDIPYRDFQTRLIPTVDPETIIGVRTPDLRRLAKELSRQEDTEAFLCELPHHCFDENQLHAFIVSEFRDYAKCKGKVNEFLPFIDNWATCDQLSPKVFRKHRSEVLKEIREWIKSDHTYTVRFGVGMLMQHFLDEDYDTAYPELVCGIRSDEYYINMMIAWYFATALAKQYDSILPYLEEHKLDPWVHNKTIQKASESYRISPEQKVYLKSLKFRAG